MTIDTQGGEFTQAPDGALFGDTSTTGSASDYAGWNWHQIEAAILGGSMLDGAGDVARAAAISSPQSLWTAGDQFYNVQTTLQMVGQSIADQSKALAGASDSPWQGAAADAFMTSTTTFSQQVLANADVLSGGLTGGSSTGHSVPNALVDNGNYLAWAQAQVSSIDTYYANLALQMPGARLNSAGLVLVSQFPQIVQMMDNDMYTVLSQLVSNYQVTIDSVTAPNTSPNANTTPNLNTMPNLNNMPNLNSAPNLNTMPNLNSAPNLNSTPNLAGTPNLSGTPNTAGLSGAGITSAPLSAAPDDDGLPTAADLAAAPGGLGSDGLPTGADLAAAPGGLGSDGLPTGAALSAAPGDDGLPTSADLATTPGGLGSDGLPTGATLTAAPGDDGLPTSADLATTPGAAGLGADDGADGGITPASLAAAPADADLPTEPSVGSPLGDEDLAQVPAYDDAPTPAGALDPAMDAALNPAPGDTGSAVGAGLPGAAAGLTGAALPGAPLESAPGDLSTAADLPTGSAVPSTGAAEPGGMPMMPGGMGAGGAAPTAEPSDASGLLSGTTEPWTGANAPGSTGEIGSANGAVTGGADLAGAPGALDSAGPPSGGLAAAGVPAAGPVPTGAAEVSGAPGASEAGGMPMMPGGMGAGGAAPVSERSDASGLLSEVTEPWSEAPAADEEAGSAAGATAGGPGLGWDGEALPEPVPDAGAPAAEFSGGSAQDPTAAELGAWAAAAFALLAPVATRAPEDGPAAGSHEAAEHSERVDVSSTGRTARPYPAEPAESAQQQSDNQAPASGGPAEADERAAWDIAGAGAGLGLGLLDFRAAERRRSEESQEVFGRTVSTEQEAWLDPEPAGQARADATAGDSGLATWHPARPAPGRSGPVQAPPVVRAGLPPADGSWPPPADPAADDGAQTEGDEEPAPREIANLLVVKPEVWGTGDDAWGLLG
jgi:hypothetical protein